MMRTTRADERCYMVRSSHFARYARFIYGADRTVRRVFVLDAIAAEMWV